MATVTARMTVWNPFDKNSPKPTDQQRVASVAASSDPVNPFAGGPKRASLNAEREMTVIAEEKPEYVPTTLPVNPLGSGMFEEISLTPDPIVDEFTCELVSEPTKVIETVTSELRLKIGKLESDGFDALFELKSIEGRGTDKDRKVITGLRTDFDKARNAQPSSSQVSTMETLGKAINLMLDDMGKRLTKPGVAPLIETLDQILSPTDGNVYTLQTADLLIKKVGGVRAGFRGMFRDVAARTEEARVALEIKKTNLVAADKFSRTPQEKKLVEKVAKVDELLQQHIEQSKK
ncbi:MAG: hypothetical protein ChlgKO_06540 [Chlamydiales bacterium]